MKRPTKEWEKRMSDLMSKPLDWIYAFIAINLIWNSCFFFGLCVRRLAISVFIVSSKFCSHSEPHRMIHLRVDKCSKCVLWAQIKSTCYAIMLSHQNETQQKKHTTRQLLFANCALLSLFRSLWECSGVDFVWPNGWSRLRSTFFGFQLTELIVFIRDALPSFAIFSIVFWFMCKCTLSLAAFEIKWQ